MDSGIITLIVTVAVTVGSAVLTLFVRAITGMINKILQVKDKFITREDFVHFEDRINKQLATNKITSNAEYISNIKMLFESRVGELSKISIDVQAVKDLKNEVINTLAQLEEKQARLASIEDNIANLNKRIDQLLFGDGKTNVRRHE
jgi:hypothetical protein